MTARLIFESVLIELSKLQAPSLKLYEFNYLVNKAINLHVNKIYNIYDINLQTTDDLRVLKDTCYLKPELTTKHSSIEFLDGATYEVDLPKDYLHLLNCICVYRVAKQKNCWDTGSYVQIPATRLTADAWGEILTDVYNRPSPMKPYYYLHNVGVGNFDDIYKVSSNGEVDSETGNVTEDKESKSNFPRTFKLNENIHASVIEKPISSRIGNASSVRCEIRYGKDSSIFKLVEVLIDYIKVPLFIRLTQLQIDLTEDTSQIMEFPDYVNLEIINELVHLVMERTSDPRLSTNIQMTQSIARPTGQL